jgi:FkbH-like protein
MKTEHIIWDSSLHAEVPKVDAGAYDAVIANMTLNAILFDSVKGTGNPSEKSPYVDFNSDLIHLTKIWNREVAEDILERATTVMRHVSTQARERISGTPIFFNSFLEPGADYEGNLISTTEITSFRYFVRKLNEAMRQVVSELHDCYYVEFNDIVNFVGRGQLQDGLQIDEASAHASFIRVGPDAEYFDTERKVDQLNAYYYSKILDNIKILRQKDSVKIIIVDLDDTLWEGNAAEEDMLHWQRRLSRLFLVEALLYFKLRGGVLAICSKNDHEPTVERFNKIWGDTLSLDDFASVKINWNPKSQNIVEILAEVNLLPESAMFIDDNPREIDDVRSRFPQLRCMGKDVMRDWRRVIINAPETQVPHISNESKQRTALIRAKIERDSLSKVMDRADWLRSLGLQEDLALIKDVSHPNYSRAFELLNKTNQFNTTGKRWSQNEIDEFFNEQGVMLVCSLKDRSSDNGLVGLALVQPGRIRQVVLSCRVFGLGAEMVLGSFATKIALRAGKPVEAEFLDTGKNKTCHDYFDRLGYGRDGNSYVTQDVCPLPEWIEVRGAEHVLELTGTASVPHE